MSNREILGVGLNATRDDIRKAYHNKVSRLDPNSSDFNTNLDAYHTAYKNLMKESNQYHADSASHVHHPSHSSHTPNYGIMPFNPFDIGRAFTSTFDSMFNNFSNFNSHFQQDFDDMTIEPEENPSGYYRSVSSVTSYTNGVKQAKSVSRVEKIHNGKKSVSTVTKTTNGDQTIIETEHPNGRKEVQTTQNTKRITDGNKN